jgi:tRNA pseudouridine55 synthase
VRPAVLNLNKPAGVTSFAVVRRLRELSAARRVGHAGTLDPLATGVLPILFESATRLADFALRLRKEYVADIHLGYESATDDAEGERVQLADPAAISPEAVEAALRGFVGSIMQAPPAYSAIKVLGQRSYRRARRGEAPRPQARLVEIYSAEVLEFVPGAEAVATIRVVCGSSTYLRALARDLGRDLQVGGYLGKLVRTAYGGLRLEDAVSLDELTDAAALELRLLAPEVILPEMERVRLTLEQEAMVRQGRAVRVLPEPGPGLVRAHDAEGRLVALGRADPLRHTFVPEKVLPPTLAR